VPPNEPNRPQPTEQNFVSWSNSNAFFDPCPWCDRAFRKNTRTHRTKCPFWVWVNTPEPEPINWHAEMEDVARRITEP
jgi:hypothetical protein